MDEIFNPIIIDARKAEEHIGKIRQEHSSILENLRNHQQKVAQFQMQKDIEKQMQMEQNRIQQKEEQIRNDDMQKANLDYNLKTKQLEAKTAEAAKI